MVITQCVHLCPNSAVSFGQITSQLWSQNSSNLEFPVGQLVFFAMLVSAVFYYWKVLAGVN